jgi:hypothetical protein
MYLFIDEFLSIFGPMNDQATGYEAAWQIPQTLFCFRSLMNPPYPKLAPQLSFTL